MAATVNAGRVKLLGKKNRGEVGVGIAVADAAKFVRIASTGSGRVVSVRPGTSRLDLPVLNE